MYIYPYTISFIAAIGDPGNSHAIGALECASRGEINHLSHQASGGHENSGN